MASCGRRTLTVFNLLNEIENAKTDVKGTAQVMTVLLERGVSLGDGVADTVERWLAADLANLDKAFEEAFHGILPPKRVGE